MLLSLRATVRLQDRCEREQERRRFKLNVGSSHGNILSELWYESDDHVTRQAASDRQQDVCCLQVCTWHDLSYIARIPLLAHGLIIKLSPCGWMNSCMCVWAFQMQSATCSGSPQDDSPAMVPGIFHESNLVEARFR